MKILILSLLFLQTAILVNSLNVGDICVISETTCKGLYDSNLNYHIKCNRLACDQDLAFQCDKYHCARNKSSCLSFLSLKFLVKFNGQLLASFRNFLKSIKTCSYDSAPNE